MIETLVSSESIASDIVFRNIASDVAGDMNIAGDMGYPTYVLSVGYLGGGHPGSAKLPRMPW